MSSSSYARVFNHPYASFEDAYKDFLDTRFEHKPFSAACIPFAWMIKEKVEGKGGEEGLAARYSIDYRPEREPKLDHSYRPHS